MCFSEKEMELAFCFFGLKWKNMFFCFLMPTQYETEGHNVSVHQFLLMAAL